jgi:hypothetical protein
MTSAIALRITSTGILPPFAGSASGRTRVIGTAGLEVRVFPCRAFFVRLIGRRLMVMVPSVMKTSNS